VLAVATSGYIFDFIDHPEGDTAVKVRAMIEGDNMVETPQLAYPGVMYPGKGAYPGAGVEGFGAAWNEVLATWKSNEAGLPNDEDRLHVETHVLMSHDFFITSDRAALVMCRRLRDEHGIAIDAASLEDYVARSAPRTAPPALWRHPRHS
jgi:hypothetical protein